jgi:hypothetical protein
MTGQLIQVGSGVWTIQREFANEDGSGGSRMTVMGLSGGGLVIHSPVQLDVTLGEEMTGLGRVMAIIAPNHYHHQFIEGWKKAFPSAKLYGSPVLGHKRSDLEFDHWLSDEPPGLWADEIDQAEIKGMPELGEFVFFHREGRTLIVADIVFNYTPEQAAADPGAADGLGPHQRRRDEIVNKTALAQSVERILQWDFDRVVVSHGEVVEHNGRELFAAGFSFLK